MNSIVKLLFFGIFLNLAIGIMMAAFPQVETLGYNQNLPKYDAGMASQFQTQIDGTINPSSVLQDASKTMFRVLDMVHIGFIFRFMGAIGGYLYASIDFLHAMIGNMLISTTEVNGVMVTDTLLHDTLFGFGGIQATGLLYIMLSCGYALAFFMLWTGKDIR